MESDILRYDLGWKALNTMLKSGRSLSGHERNCAFLNTGDMSGTSRFADISAAAGIDFDDDGQDLRQAGSVVSHGIRHSIDKPTSSWLASSHG